MDTIFTQSEEETLAWAQEFATHLRLGDVVALQGNLGAGKTVISRGICKALGFTGSIHSPTYALVHEYPNTPPIYHLDLYRLGPGADLAEIGIDHYAFSEGITLIEWPERLEEHDSGVHWWVTVESTGDDERKISVRQIKKAAI